MTLFGTTFGIGQKQKTSLWPMWRKTVHAAESRVGAGPGSRSAGPSSLCVNAGRAETGGGRPLRQIEPTDAAARGSLCVNTLAQTQAVLRVAVGDDASAK